MKKIVTNIWLCFKRLKSNLLALAVGIIVLPLAIICYLQFGSVSPIGKIAVVNPEENFLDYLNENNLDYERMEIIPEKDKIMNGEYIGYIECKNEKVSYVSYTGKSKEKILERIAAQKTLENEETKDIISSIFPCILVIMFLQAVLNMKLFIEDRQNGMLERLRLGGMGQNTYLLSQVAYNSLITCIPAIITLFVCKILFHLAYELTAFQLIAAVCITAVTSALVALTVCSLVKKNESAIMVGNAVAVISTLLSGVFGTSQNIVFVNKIMPQNIIMEWIQSFKYADSEMLLTYVKMFIMIFLLGAVSYFVNRNTYWRNERKSL